MQKRLEGKEGKKVHLELLLCKLINLLNGFERLENLLKIESLKHIVSANLNHSKYVLKRLIYQLSDPYSKLGENPSLNSALNGVLNFPLYLTMST